LVSRCHPGLARARPHVYKANGNQLCRTSRERARLDDGQNGSTSCPRVETVTRKAMLKWLKSFFSGPTLAEPPQVLRAFSPGQPTITGRHSRGPRWVADRRDQGTDDTAVRSGRPWRGAVSAELSSRT
jgi:hypothetical protein